MMGGCRTYRSTISGFDSHRPNKEVKTMMDDNLKKCETCAKAVSADGMGTVVCIPRPGSVSSALKDTPADDLECWEEIIDDPRNV